MTELAFSITKAKRTATVLFAFAFFCGASTAEDRPPVPDEGPLITAANAGDLQVVAEFEDDLFGVTWNPDGRELAFLRWEKPIEIRDPATFKIRSTIEPDRRVIAFAFSKDLDVYAFSENTTIAHLVSVNAKDSVELETENPQPGLDFSADGKLLATGGYGTSAALWSVPEGRLLRRLEMGRAEGGLTVSFRKDGKWLAVGNRNSNTRLFEIGGDERVVELPKPMSQGLRFNPTGDVLAVTYVNGSLSLWDVETGRELRSVKSGAEELFRVDWSPDEQLLVTAGLKGHITLWNPKDLSMIRQLESPEWVIEAEFSPDGRRLLTAGGSQDNNASRSVKIWGVVKPQ